MKRLLGLIVLTALLLCGCSGHQPIETTDPQPTETTPVAEVVTLLEKTEGALSTFTAENGCVRVLRMGDHMALVTADGVIRLLSGPQLQLVTTCDTGCAMTSDDLTLRVHGDQLSYFDPERRAVVILGKHLTEISATVIREEFVGNPLICPDFSQIYYATSDSIRVIEVKTGVSRLLRQEHGTIASLDGLYFDGAVLGYTRTSGDQTERCFIQVSDGAQTDPIPLTGQITTWGSRFAGELELALPMGAQRWILTGTTGGALQMVTPEAHWDRLLFPGEGTMLLQTMTDSGAVALKLYDLDTGAATSAMELSGFSRPFDHAWLDGQSLWLWNETEARFFRWDLTPTQSSDNSILTDCSSLADPVNWEEGQTASLSEQYGIPIRLVQGDNRTSGVDYSVYPDYRPEQYALALAKLEQLLAKFPADFFPQLVNNSPVVIELVDDFDPALEEHTGTGEMVIGQTERVIRVSICQELEPIFYHELFHAVDLFVYGQTNELEFWQDENPRGFDYTGSYADYEAGLYADSEYLSEGENAFADEYCLISAREDRAQTFMYAMMDDQAARFASSTMHDKLELLSDALRDTFKGYKKSDEVFRWEQYLED